MLRRALAGKLMASLLLTSGFAASAASAAAAAPSRHMHINCAESTVCAEVGQYQDVFGSNYYVGHDEPTVQFYSRTAGSGNRTRYTLTLPKDPSPSNPNAAGKSYDFELGSTIWFGMSMCDTQSYPEQVDHCTPDSDSNVTRNLAKYPGGAFTELQFYSPGWVGWPTWAVAAGASTCDPTKWCAALNIDSLSEDPVNGTVQNPTCAAKTGLEYVNFAFVTHDGKAQAPANPLQSTLTTFTPDHTKDLFMNPGDKISVAMFDTPDGLRVALNDLTTGQRGFMTASPANGFAQFKYDPTGDSCQAIPYAFHPMYSTSTEGIGTIWGADQYNVAFDQEIGHFQHCNGASVPATPFGVTDNGTPISCPSGNTEELGQPAEDPLAGGDNNFCFPESESQLVRVQGCTDTNTGFDGMSYLPVWPDGNTALHPTPVQFSSPLTGARYDEPYQSAGLAVDLPRIEANTCNRETGAGCTLIPTRDNGEPARFYPYFSITGGPSACLWQLGGAIPGTTNDFGKNAGYGTLIHPRYLVFGGGGLTDRRYNDFRNVLRVNPCPA
jgi:hypothetical protein